MRLFLLIAVSSISFAQGSSYKWLKELAGSGNDVAIGLAMDRAGNTYVAGNTSSSDFPVVNAFQPLPAGAPLFLIDAAANSTTALHSAPMTTANDVAFDPHDPKTLYALGATSVARSTDGGRTWTSHGIPGTFYPNSIAVAFDGSSSIVYITADDMIYRSVDFDNWQPISGGIKQPGRVYSVTVDPRNPARLFARTLAGLAWSEDAGASWTQSGVFVYNITFDPIEPSTVYAGGMGALKSTDSGKTWTTLGAFPAQDVSPQTVLRDPLNPGLLYASTYGSLFISADGGQTWTTKHIVFDGVLLADSTTGTVYGVSSSQLIMTRDGFSTVTPIGPPSLPPYSDVKASRGAVLVGSFSSSDLFVTKLDADGNIVYSTYVGGTSYDTAMAMAVDASGSVYVTGFTSSLDFPVTTGAYLTKPSQSGPNFLFKIDPNGKLAWSTFFGPGAGTVATIAVDAAGSVYLGGASSGGLPTTPGSYQPVFSGTYPPGGPGFIGPPLPQPTNAFVTKFKPDGSGLIYSTYIGKQTDTGNTLAVAPDGSAYIGGSQHYFKLSADGSSLLATAVPPFLPVQTITDSAGDLWAVGSTAGALSIAGSTHKFINAVSAPPLPGGYGIGNGVAVVTKFAPDLTPLETALIGGENSDQAHSVALDSSGNVVLGGLTTSQRFPTRAPLQSTFASQTGFIAQLSGDLSTLSFSSYEGDTRTFSVLNAVPSNDGSIVFGGSTLNATTILLGPYVPPAPLPPPQHVFVVKLAVETPPLRLDRVANAASIASVPLAANEAIVLTGDGFGTNPQVLVDSRSITVLSATPQSITAVLPPDFKSNGASQVAVSSADVLSNSVAAPVAPGAPGIFTIGGSGFGQGYILNADGTQNSAANPAAVGSVITIFLTGPGPTTFSGLFAVTELLPAVFIDGFYANGVDARMGPVAGLPGDVYQLSVTIPDPSQLASLNPNLANFRFPPQVAMQVLIGNVYSQPGVSISIR